MAVHFAGLGRENYVGSQSCKSFPSDSLAFFLTQVSQLPAGVPALATFVHNLGLKFGVYSDGCVANLRFLRSLPIDSSSGVFACDFVGGTAHFVGSLGHETSDAATFASWGADYLKYDNCYAVNSTDFVDFNPPISVKFLFLEKNSAYVI